MTIIRDIAKRSKEDKEIEKKDTELLRTVNRIWETFNLNEKLYILEKSGYKLEK